MPLMRAVTLSLVSLRQLIAATLAWANVSSAVMASENNFTWGRRVGSCLVSKSLGFGFGAVGVAPDDVFFAFCLSYLSCDW